MLRRQSLFCCLLKASRCLLCVQRTSLKEVAEQLIGPFAVIECVGEVAHELLLPASMGCIHHESHVMLLRMYKDGGRPASPPPAVLPDDEEECETQQALSGKVM